MRRRPPLRGRFVFLLFLAARDAKPEGACEDAKAVYDAWLAQVGNTNDGDDGGIPPSRCDERRWTCRTTTANGNIPVPITVTAGGTLDDEPVAGHTWKLMFDSKTFSCDILRDLENQARCWPITTRQNVA